MLRTQADHAAACPGSVPGSRPAAHETNAEYGAAGALIVANSNNETYWGISTGWYDQDWCWHVEYDRAQACGVALAHAVRTGAYTWRRSFQHCEVSVDTRNTTGTIVPR